LAYLTTQIKPYLDSDPDQTLAGMLTIAGLVYLSAIASYRYNACSDATGSPTRSASDAQYAHGVSSLGRERAAAKDQDQEEARGAAG
jgi:hypothetical protein